MIWVFPKIVGFPPKSSILIGFSITNHPFWDIPIFGNTHFSTVFFYQPAKTFDLFANGTKGLVSISTSRATAREKTTGNLRLNFLDSAGIHVIFRVVVVYDEY